MAQQQIWQWSTRTTLLASGSEKVFYDVLKRSMDILLATALIILLLPLLLLIALLIKLDSPGPVIFTQERVGAKRQRFGNYRFWVVQNFTRSEEHTSELQSHSDLVCRLLLEKKKNKEK